MRFLYLGIGAFDVLNILNSYILVNKIICEDLMKITQIFVEIWTQLL